MISAHFRRPTPPKMGDMSAMNRFLFCLLLVILLCGCAVATPSQPAEFRKAPYLLFTGQSTSMAVMWQTRSTPAQAQIEWGEDESYAGGKANVKEVPGIEGDHLFMHTIEGLKPGARVFYRVTVDGQALASSFFTAPANPEQFSIYAVSDTQVNPAVHNQVMGAILKDIRQQPAARQTILLHGGDHISHGLYEPDWDIEYFNQAYPNVTAVLGSLPVVGALSNHLLYEAQEYVKICSRPYAKVFRKYFPYPLYTTPDHFYYSFDYGPVHIVVVDPYTAEFQEGSEQYQWLQADLANPARFTVVMMHQPAWSYRWSSYALRQHLHGLFKAGGVDLVIQGHDHFYSRLVVDGIQYVVIGGGGGSLTYPGTFLTRHDDPADTEIMSTCVDVAFEPDPNLPEVNLVDPLTAARTNHYLRMDLAGDKLAIRVVNLDGKVIDCFPEGAVCAP